MASLMGRGGERGREEGREGGKKGIGKEEEREKRRGWRGKRMIQWRTLTRAIHCYLVSVSMPTQREPGRPRNHIATDTDTNTYKHTHTHTHTHTSDLTRCNRMAEVIYCPHSNTTNTHCSAVLTQLIVLVEDLLPAVETGTLVGERGWGGRGRETRTLTSSFSTGAFSSEPHRRSSGERRVEGSGRGG